MNNVLVAYDLNTIGQDYQRVIGKIKALGNSVQLQRSLWLLKTMHSATDVRDVLLTVIDNNDSLVVVDAKAIAWHGISNPAENFINFYWNL